MKKSILIALFTMFIIFHAFSQQNIYGGKWVINKSKTEFGNQPEWVLPSSISVITNTKHFETQRIVVNDDSSESKTDIVLNLNGEGTDTVANTGIKIKGFLNYGDGSKPILTFQTFSSDDLPIAKITEQWSLSEDGKLLLINRTVDQADGYKYIIKGYYDREN